MYNFDVFIIGTGTAGATAAAMLRDAGLSVAIADNDDYGGTCALRGCQPKKYLVVPAHAALEGAGLTQRGFVQKPQLDWSVIQRSRAEFTESVPQSTEDGLRDKEITTFHGTCRFLDAETVECGSDIIRAQRILIAAGARPRSSVPSVYAAGDCVASIQRSPVSDAGARVAAQNIILDLVGPDEAGTTGAPDHQSTADEDRPQLDLSVLPTVVFTYPQLAQFGLSESEAQKRGGVRINTGSGAGWPNYRRLDESNVMHKVIIDENRADPWCTHPRTGRRRADQPARPGCKGRHAGEGVPGVPLGIPYVHERSQVHAGIAGDAAGHPQVRCQEEPTVYPANPDAKS